MTPNTPYRDTTRTFLFDRVKAANWITQRDTPHLTDRPAYHWSRWMPYLLHWLTAVMLVDLCLWVVRWCTWAAQWTPFWWVGLVVATAISLLACSILPAKWLPRLIAGLIIVTLLAVPVVFRMVTNVPYGIDLPSDERLDRRGCVYSPGVGNWLCEKAYASLPGAQPVPNSDMVLVPAVYKPLPLPYLAAPFVTH